MKTLHHRIPPPWWRARATPLVAGLATCACFAASAVVRASDPPPPGQQGTAAGHGSGSQSDSASLTARDTEKKSDENFFQRLDGAFREQLGTPAYTPPDTTASPATGAPSDHKNVSEAAASGSVRRIPPAPFDSPPYPTAEWQIGGTAIIGDPGIVPPGPLMQALYEGPGGQAIKNSRIQLYGWEDVSGNLSTSTNKGLGPNGQSGNFPTIYDQRPDRVEQQQFVVYLERVPDEAQTDHIDVGFRLSALYGLTYRYTISRGFVSDQLLKHNSFYGYDFPMLYADIYIPKIFKGVNVRIGRIISMPDIEAQLAPNNLLDSHSLLYSYDPYTQWGIFATFKLSNVWSLQLGLSAGNDVAPWQADQGRQPTGSVLLQWISPNGKDSFYGGMNAFNNGDFGYNNLQQLVGTYTHKFNEKWWTITEGWFMYQRNAKDQPTAAVPYQNGSFPKANGFAPEVAILNYTQYRVSGSTYLSFRNEFFDDIRGNRTGYATSYSEHALGVVYWPDKIITIRPEIRLDHSYDKRAFDNGTRQTQITANMDVIVHF